MIKLYQIINFQYQPVPVPMFENLDDAKRHIASLKEIYAEKFYVIELSVAYQA